MSDTRYYPRKKKKKKGYDRAGVLSLDYLSGLKDYRNPLQYKTIGGFEVKISSQRYPVFQRSTKCCICGLEGTHLAIERAGRAERYHLNLYATKDGKEILMTKDHIIPKSKGGLNVQANFQTMCTHCNGKKASKNMDEFLLTIQ